MGSTMRFIILAVGLLFANGCRPELPESVPLPTSLNLRVLHHTQPIAHLPVYLKYYAAEFPGYDDPEKWADTILRTDARGRLSLRPIPEGKHWLVAIGYDSVPLPHLVWGQLPFSINLDINPNLDTVMYVTE